MLGVRAGGGGGYVYENSNYGLLSFEENLGTNFK